MATFIVIFFIIVVIGAILRSIFENEDNQSAMNPNRTKGVAVDSTIINTQHIGSVHENMPAAKTKEEADKINKAYRAADHERWQDEWFVIGIRIHLSNNHTLNGKPFHDICDLLEGDYPKAFKFTGWHPQCRCYVTSILCSDEDFEEYLQRQREGKDVSGFRFKGEITDIPESMKQWIKANKSGLVKLKEEGVLPDWILDNPKYINI